jgi:hypothetical protein
MPNFQCLLEFYHKFHLSQYASTLIFRYIYIYLCVNKLMRIKKTKISNFIKAVINKDRLTFINKYFMLLKFFKTL